MRQLLLILALVALVGCGGGKKEETQGISQPEPATPPQATEKSKPPKVLGLVDNKITKAGVAQLKKALPKCIILSIPKK